MAKPNTEEGDPQLRALFEKFGGRLISPGGAAALLGVSRQTIHTLGERGKLRIFRSEDQVRARIINSGPRWAFIPLEDVQRYGHEVGRPVPRT